MRKWALQIYDYLTAHRRVAVGLLLLMLALCAGSALRMRYDEDIAAFLPQGPESKRYSEVYERLGSQDRMAVFFTGGDLDARLDAMAAFEEIWARTDSAGMVPDLKAAAEDATVTDVLGFLSANWPYFMTEEDYARADSLLAVPDYIPQRLEEDKVSLYSPVSSLSSAYLRSDPLGLFAPVPARLRALDPSGNNRLEDGYLLTPDGETGIVFFSSPFGGSETARNGELVALLDRVKTLTMDACPGITVTSTGGPEVAVENARRIKKDSAVALLLAALLICIVLWLSYRRWSDVLWILLSIAAGALFALGIIALFRSSVSIIILGIGSMIIGIAVNYPLHYIDHLKYQPDKRKALAEQVNPLLIGNITTVGAFLSLLLMKAQALRDFGFIGAMMLVGTILFVLVFLPVLAPSHAGPRKTLKLDLDRHIRLSDRGRKICFIAFLCLTAVFWVLSTRISFDGDMHHINYMTPAQSRGFDLLQSLSGESDGRQTLYLVAEGKDAEEALDRAARLPAGTSSVLPFLPSEKVQQARLSAWKDFLGRHPGLGAAVDAAAARTGFSATAFEPFRELLSKDWAVQSAGYFTPLTGTVGQAHYLPGEDRVQVINYWKLPAEELNAVRTRLRASLPEGTFCFSPEDVQGSLVGLLSQDFDKVGLICSLIVFFFLWLSFGSLELSVMSFLPLAAGWIWILGTMHLFGLQFNIVNIILATFIFGQGDDYTIFMTEGLMYEYATGKPILRSYKNAVVLSALIMFIGIGALVTARHPAMRSLGQVTVIGMFTVVLMAYYLPPLVFRWLTMSKGQPRRTPLTLRQMASTAHISVVFFLAMLVLSVWAFCYFLVGKDSEEKWLRYHRVIMQVARRAIKTIPGAPYTLDNAVGEDFSKPALYVCNHQSHFDVLALLALQPKLVFMTNDWVWNFPLYGYLIHKAEFYPASNGIAKNFDHMKNLVARGYSVAIFPEGTRSEDCHIQRFHRGAFVAAKELGLEILPLLIHGFGHALPKHHFCLHRASLSMKVYPRVAVPEGDIAAFTRQMRAFYTAEYDAVSRERETPAYLAPRVRDNYVYKGHDALQECRRVLRPETYAAIASLPAEPVTLPDAGCGVYALLLALSRPDIAVTAYIAEEDAFLTAVRCPDVPSNLTYVHGTAPVAEESAV